MTTRYARGTTGYRAPELVREAATYNNKVDIWAFGCLAFELITRQKAFDNDWGVMNFTSADRISARFQFALLSMDIRSKALLREIINATLELDSWKRPCTINLLEVITSFNGLQSVAVIGSRSTTEREPQCDQNPEWTLTKWRAYWYHPILFARSVLIGLVIFAHRDPIESLSNVIKHAATITRTQLFGDLSPFPGKVRKSWLRIDCFELHLPTKKTIVMTGTSLYSASLHF
jgi:serine/threonine protein kinase